ncbi:MAG: hypothetical protein V4514_09245 [Pseudomonadota bacterium]|uniref:hypothetical protein n=1 Tax=unclassified Phenylobacterium TaxID=2640670 RepID=UPI0006FBF6D5|nr:MULTISPECIES: hypothetical protein [unclassified Phenylobacterium]KRB39880.1 hypothetical protein ASE02_08760 [Phenylobacterium sp. Root700]MBT9472325.1 hypothetical protein [Phenylobacterium sp.]
MRSLLTFGAAALALAITSAPALAQSSAQPAPPADEASPAASSPSGSDASATAASLAVGATVKDKTGTSIGEVTAVKPDPNGKQVATIKMGADTFAVETDKLAVADGSATINATQAELKAMLGKK